MTAISSSKDWSNYWGYNPLNYFSPEPSYASDPNMAVREFKMMVRALHDAGLEVIMDVVYNHTGEGNHMGPTLSYKGIDNYSYYKMNPRKPPLLHGLYRYRQYARRWATRKWCGSSPTRCAIGCKRCRWTASASTSLRHWHEKSTTWICARFVCKPLRQDPVLSKVKLIAEPWDIGPVWLSGGRVPVVLGRVERALPRYGERLLARRQRFRLEPRTRHAHTPAAATSTRTTGANLTTRSTSSPRTTASPCKTW